MPIFSFFLDAEHCHRSCFYEAIVVFVLLSSLFPVAISAAGVKWCLPYDRFAPSLLVVVAEVSVSILLLLDGFLLRAGSLKVIPKVTLGANLEQSGMHYRGQLVIVLLRHRLRF